MNSYYQKKFLRAVGTEGRARTDTPVKEPDFESGASTSSATPAREGRVYQVIYGVETGVLTRIFCSLSGFG